MAAVEMMMMMMMMTMMTTTTTTTMMMMMCHLQPCQLSYNLTLHSRRFFKVN